MRSGAVHLSNPFASVHNTWRGLTEDGNPQRIGYISTSPPVGLEVHVCMLDVVLNICDSSADKPP